MVSVSPVGVAGGSRSWRHRLALDGVTAEVAAPRRPFGRPLAVVLGGYPESPAPSPPDILVTISQSALPGRWDVAADTQRFPNSFVDIGLATQRAEWLVISEIVRRLPRLIHVHAAVLATPRQSLLLVGHSGSGKSTTSVALAQLGMALYTDDVALLEPTTLRPIYVPRPIKLDDRSRRLLKGMGLSIPRGARVLESVARTALPGLPPADAPGPPVRTVVFLGWPSNGRAGLRRLSSAEAAIRLIQESTSEQLDAATPSEGALAVIKAAACYELLSNGLPERLQAIVELSNSLDDGAGEHTR
jgi:hypothetical protein